MISSLLGRDFLSTGLEELGAEGSLDFDAFLASDILEDAAPGFGLDFTLASGSECLAGSVLVTCSLCCMSFCIEVVLEDEVGRTGTTGLIAALVVTLR